MAKAKTPLIDKNIEKFINNNFDRRDRKKDSSKKFEWFVNSMHIWHCSSQFFNSNTKIGKDISLGDSQGGDAFFISVNNYNHIYTLNDNIDEVIDYLKKHGKSITFHFIQTKKTEHINWGQFLNLIDIPLTIWNGNEFSTSQPTLQKIQEFIDKITDDDDHDLKKIKEHKLEICFYTNKDENALEKLQEDWNTGINNKKNDLNRWFSSDKIDIIFRGGSFLNDVYEKINSNDYELSVNKENVIEVETQKYLIGFITAKELLNSISPEIKGKKILYTDVFKNNIRLYLGRNAVNEKIEQTLIDEPEKFHLYNNGLTITTKSISNNSRNFIIKPVNIVNGCQTANSIYNVSRLDDFLDKDIKIPVRIIVAEDNEYEKITIRTNTQNGLDAKDLISITNIQKELQEEFSKLNIINKTFYYKRQKSTEDSISDVDFIVQIDDVLRAAFSTIMLVPNKVSGYFDQTTLKYIEKIFDERFVSLYLISTALLKLIDEFIDEQYSKYSRLKYHILYITYKIAAEDIAIKDIEEYIREDNSNEDDTEDKEELIKQNISLITSNMYKIVNDEMKFKQVMDYIISKIEINYPELANIVDKKTEKVLYKHVEKLKRVRVTIMDNFYDVFSDSITEIIQINGTE